MSTRTVLILVAAFCLGFVATFAFSGCQNQPPAPAPVDPADVSTPDIQLPDFGGAEEEGETGMEAAEETADDAGGATAEEVAEPATAEEDAAGTAPAAEGDEPATEADDAPQGASTTQESAAETVAAAEKPAAGGPAPQTAALNSAALKPGPDRAVAAAEVKAVAKIPAVDKTANAPIEPGDWRQWGGTSYRNNTPIAKGIPIDWEIGEFDRKTGAWISDNARNIKWVALLGSQTYGNPVVADGRVYVGTNNGAGWLKRYPSQIDLGCLLSFRESDGQFLWQDSSEKLPTGRVHDWPLQGICCAPLVEGTRVWYVTSRGEVKCLDAEGYYDGEDDGPVQNQWGRIFDAQRNEDPERDIVAPIVAALDAGQVSDQLRAQFQGRGVELPEQVGVVAGEPAGRQWMLTARIGEADRQLRIDLAGPRLSAFKLITPDDKEEADVIWSYDMMGQQRVSQHNMCSCSVTALGDILFVNTSNGVDESHINIPSPDAPSFMAMDKNTGEVLWTDKSPGVNILHGQWSSPTVASLGGVPQVIFGGGDGWVYSFRADKGQEGKPELLWKFDANPKESKWILGGRGTRNNIIGTPVVYDGLVYVAVGQDPEHGEGIGHLWCLDPNKRGDVSTQLAMKVTGDTREPIQHRRLQAVIAEEGEVAVDNPNSAVLWHYSQFDQNGDGFIDFEEEMHRSCGTVVIKNDLLFVADFSGLFHCLDAKSGKVHWTYDMLAAAWGSALIVEDHVYIGDEDGDLAIFNLSGDPQVAMKEIEGELHPINADEDSPNFDVTNMANSVYSTPVVANGVLYISNKTHLFAISEQQTAE